jgi:hypothetical protein
MSLKVASPPNKSLNTGLAISSRSLFNIGYSQPVKQIVKHNQQSTYRAIIMSDMKTVLGPIIEKILLLLGVASAFMGFASPLVHIFLVLGVFPVIVCAVIEGWERKNIAFKEIKSEPVVSYIHGIPVKGEHHSLRNMHFRDANELTTRLSSIMKAKTFLVVTNFLLVIYNLYSIAIKNEQDLYWFSQIAFGIGVLFFIGTKLQHTLKMQSACSKNLWHIESMKIKNTLLHSAYITNRETENITYSPFFGALFR